MGSEATIHADKPSMTLNELVAFTKKELDADAERQAKVAAIGTGELQSQTGVTLDLSHKNVHALPLEVIALIKDKVERLALSHNPQIAVPTQIVQCDRLRYLNIRWNQLKYFPEAVLQLSALEILDLSKNRILSIPEDIKRMTSLKFLAVARNKITRLPLALGDMTSLSKLKFDENPIEFPPLDALTPSQDRSLSNIESEKDRDVCQLVKRFLKAASLRERLRVPSVEDVSSESTLETPRPPKRTVTGGRFPVRPSISGIDNIDDLKAKSPNDAPPIPQKSHARVASSNAPVLKRPGIAPLLTGGNDISRSRSETVSSSASLRARRQGYVPRKHIDLSSVTEHGDTASVRSSQASTIKAAHSRNPSSASTFNGFLTASSGGETSSGAVSPIDGPLNRFGSVRRLSSLPENRNSKLQTSDAFKAAKRLLFILFRLHGPMGEVTAALKEGTPKRSILERQLFTANAHVEELDRLLSRLENALEDNVKGEEHAMQPIVKAAVAALKSYGHVVKELKKNTRKIVSVVDAVYVRCLIIQIYATIVEARNVCFILGFKLKGSAPKSTPRASRAWSSRTVTPTQSKPVNNRRMRGATILQSVTGTSTLRTMPPPVPLNVSGSRTNTMTSLSAATSRLTESFSTVSTSTLQSRSNTMRTVMDDMDNDEQFDKIFLKLRSACDLAAHSLPHCRAEFVVHKDGAENASQTRVAHHWSLAINRCDAVIHANNTLINRLRVVKLKDPGLRNQRDFWQLCDVFVQSWTDLATEIKDIAQQRLDITHVRIVMKPVQKAVKEVSKTISESPLYHQAVRPSGPNSAGSQPLAPPFPASVHAAFAQQALSGSGTQSGYVTPVPATPLSAALGPAVQATVACTPNSTHVPPDYLQAGNAFVSRSSHERVDTMMQPLGHSRR